MKNKEYNHDHHSALFIHKFEHDLFSAVTSLWAVFNAAVNAVAAEGLMSW